VHKMMPNKATCPRHKNSFPGHSLILHLDLFLLDETIVDPESMEASPCERSSQFHKDLLPIESCKYPPTELKRSQF
jgi:hypothetical protein